jgi:hypothetical protein
MIIPESPPIFIKGKKVPYISSVGGLEEEEDGVLYSPVASSPHKRIFFSCSFRSRKTRIAVTSYFECMEENDIFTLQDLKQKGIIGKLFPYVVRDFAYEAEKWSLNNLCQTPLEQKRKVLYFDNSTGCFLAYFELDAIYDGEDIYFGRILIYINLNGRITNCVYQVL